MEASRRKEADGGRVRALQLSLCPTSALNPSARTVVRRLHLSSRFSSSLEHRVPAVSALLPRPADSDAVWACLLPSVLPPLADRELLPAPLPCRKDLFIRSLIAPFSSRLNS